MGFKNFAAGIPIVGGLFEDDNPEEKMMEELRKQREAGKAKQYDYLGQMKGPMTAEATKRRLAALEQDSQDGPLVTDKYFQGQRAAAVQGGQQAVAGVQNKQHGYGISGGFSNVGSVQDAYDRLGGQLANIGAQAGERRANARDQAAELEQGLADRDMDFFNNQLKAKMAIESGDSNAAMDAIREAYGAKQKQNERNAQTRGSYTSSLLNVFNPFKPSKMAVDPSEDAPKKFDYSGYKSKYFGKIG